MMMNLGDFTKVTTSDADDLKNPHVFERDPTAFAKDSSVGLLMIVAIGAAGIAVLVGVLWMVFNWSEKE